MPLDHQNDVTKTDTYKVLYRGDEGKITKFNELVKRLESDWVQKGANHWVQNELVKKTGKSMSSKEANHWVQNELVKKTGKSMSSKEANYWVQMNLGKDWKLTEFKKG